MSGGTFPIRRDIHSLPCAGRRSQLARAGSCHPAERRVLEEVGSPGPCTGRDSLTRRFIPIDEDSRARNREGGRTVIRVRQPVGNANGFAAQFEIVRVERLRIKGSLAVEQQISFPARARRRCVRRVRLRRDEARCRSRIQRGGIDC